MSILGPKTIRRDPNDQYNIVRLTKVSAPVATAATNITTTSFQANWNAVADLSNLLYYTLQVATDAAFTSIVAGYDNIRVDGLSKIVAGLTEETSYYYRVRAFGFGGYSSPSNTILAQTDESLIFVEDTFTDTTGVDLGAHVGELGASWTRHGDSSWNNAMLIDSLDRAYPSVAGAGSGYFASGVPASADYKVSGTFFFFGADNQTLGLCARMNTSGARSAYVGGWQSTSPGPRWHLYRMNAGVLTLIGSFLEAHPGGGASVLCELSVQGSSIKFSRNGQVVIDVVDTVLVAAGRVGFEGFNFTGGWPGPGDGTGIHLVGITGTYFA